MQSGRFLEIYGEGFKCVWGLGSFGVFISDRFFFSMFLYIFFFGFGGYVNKGLKEKRYKRKYRFVFKIRLFLRIWLGCQFFRRYNDVCSWWQRRFVVRFGLFLQRGGDGLLELWYSDKGTDYLGGRDIYIIVAFRYYGYQVEVMGFLRRCISIFRGRWVYLDDLGYELSFSRGQLFQLYFIISRYYIRVFVIGIYFWFSGFVRYFLFRYRLGFM